VIDIASGVDIIKKSGTWFSYAEERLGQGKEAARRFLREHPAITAEIAAKVLAHHGVTDKPEAGEAAKGEAGAASVVASPDVTSVSGADDGDALGAGPRKKPGAVRART